MPLLEIACFTPESAAIASRAGADRIELCDNQSVGGTTPPAEWLDSVKFAVPVFVMIRPRGGDFVYSDTEFQTMKADIDRYKNAVDGFVFGILDREHNVDIARTRQLVERARPLPCTFHRAFDKTSSPVEAVEDVVGTGCKAILTSGGAPNVTDGLEMLRTLIEVASDRIEVIPGGGVRSGELGLIHKKLQASVYHSSAILGDGGLPDRDEIRKMRAMLSGSG